MGMHPRAMHQRGDGRRHRRRDSHRAEQRAGGASAAEANRTTLLIAFGACLAYVAIVPAEAATPSIGAFQTMWIDASPASSSSAASSSQRARLAVPREWVPFVGLQGGLDSLGYLTFLVGANSAAPYVTMVLASAFSVVTVVLAARAS